MAFHVRKSQSGCQTECQRPRYAYRCVQIGSKGSDNCAMPKVGKSV